VFYFVRRTRNKTLKRNAETTLKRFSYFRHAVLNIYSACCWNISVLFDIACCATAEIEQFRRLETEFCFSVLFQFYFTCVGTITSENYFLFSHNNHQ